ncbi:hypothetical protein OSTOST_12587, partial [Ostertagia ostertagi]
AADGSLYPTPALGYARVPLPQVPQLPQIPQVPQYGTVPYAPARRNPLLGAQFMKPINVPITQTSLKCQKCNCCALLASGFSITGGYPPIGGIGPNGKIGPLGPIYPRPGSKHLCCECGECPGRPVNGFPPPSALPLHQLPHHTATSVHALTAKPPFSTTTTTASPPFDYNRPIDVPGFPPSSRGRRLASWPFSPMPSPPPIVQPLGPPSPVLPPLPVPPPPVVPPVGPPAQIIPPIPPSPLVPPVGPPSPVIPPVPSPPIRPSCCTPRTDHSFSSTAVSSPTLRTSSSDTTGVSSDSPYPHLATPIPPQYPVKPPIIIPSRALPHMSSHRHPPIYPTAPPPVEGYPVPIVKPPSVPVPVDSYAGTPLPAPIVTPGGSITNGLRCIGGK